jgi:DNA-binding NarL/FixJ family response regulator
MLSDKSVLLERMHVAINEKWSHSVQSSNTASAEKLEQRMQVLEKQNDQLLYFVNFLVENLPDLVINILQGEWQGKDEPERLQPVKCGAIPCPTRREQDVLELLVKGFCAKEIAEKLFISETTVITHKKNLKDKFKAKNTVELISKAQHHLSGKKVV